MSSLMPAARLQSTFQDPAARLKLQAMLEQENACLKHQLAQLGSRVPQETERTVGLPLGTPKQAQHAVGHLAPSAACRIKASRTEWQPQLPDMSTQGPRYELDSSIGSSQASTPEAYESFSRHDSSPCLRAWQHPQSDSSIDVRSEHVSLGTHVQHQPGSTTSGNLDDALHRAWKAVEQNSHRTQAPLTIILTTCNPNSFRRSQYTTGRRDTHRSVLHPSMPMCWGCTVLDDHTSGPALFPRHIQHAMTQGTSTSGYAYCWG